MKHNIKKTHFKHNKKKLKKNKETKKKTQVKWMWNDDERQNKRWWREVDGDVIMRIVLPSNPPSISPFTITPLSCYPPSALPIFVSTHPLTTLHSVLHYFIKQPPKLTYLCRRHFLGGCSSMSFVGLLRKNENLPCVTKTLMCVATLNRQWRSTKHLDNMR